MDKLPFLQSFFAFLSKNERAVWFTIIAALGYLNYIQYQENRKQYEAIIQEKNTTISYERKKAEDYENIIKEQIKQQFLRDQILKEQSSER